MAVRGRLHRAGLRFRIHYRPLPHTRGEADIAFLGKRILVQIDGCFWHGCPAHATYPAHNREWWATKLQSNMERDRRLGEQFTAAGWKVMRFWEHQAVDEIVEAVQHAIADAADASHARRTLR